MSLVVDKCKFIDNSASFGAGIYVENINHFTLTNSAFTSCEGQHSGGGCYVESKEVIIKTEDTNFTSCFADQHSGGLYINSSYTRKNNAETCSCLITGCIFTSCIAPYGGGLSFDSSYISSTIQSCSFINCESAWTNYDYGGGGIYYRIYTGLKAEEKPLKDLIFEGNKAFVGSDVYFIDNRQEKNISIFSNCYSR